MSRQLNEPGDCPEYPRCNAPICPLDRDWHRRTYVKNEPICLFLSETVKPGADARLAVNPTYAELHEVCQGWLAAEQQESDRNPVLPRGRPLHLKAVLAAAGKGSTLDSRAATSQRMSRQKSGAAGQGDDETGMEGA